VQHGCHAEYLAAPEGRDINVRRMQHTNLIGYIAASLTTIAFIPQAWLTFRARRAHGVSGTTYLIFSVGVALWLLYGILLSAWPVILANAITLVLALFILSMKLRYG
jgi:MtN3 and saliva related transmembrane protein